MYNFQDLSNNLGIVSTKIALSEMHYIDQSNPANLLDEFLAVNTFDPVIFDGANKKLVVEYVDRFVRQVQDAAKLLGDYTGISSCVGDSHPWSFSKKLDVLKVVVKFAQSKVQLTSVISDAGIEYKLDKGGRRVFDREEVNESKIFFTPCKISVSDTHQNSNCFDDIKSKNVKGRSDSIPLSPGGVIVLSSRELEVYRRMVGKFGADYSGYTREVIMTVTSLKFHSFHDHFNVMSSMALMHHSNGYYFYNHEAMKAIVSKLESIDYFGVGRTFLIASEFLILELIHNSKEPVLKSRLSGQQKTNVERAAERGKGYIDYYRNDDDHALTYKCSLTEYGKFIYQTYIDIYKIIESYVLHKKFTSKQLEVA